MRVASPERVLSPDSCDDPLSLHSPTSFRYSPTPPSRPRRHAFGDRWCDALKALRAGYRHHGSLCRLARLGPSRRPHVPSPPPPPPCHSATLSVTGGARLKALRAGYRHHGSLCRLVHLGPCRRLYSFLSASSNPLPAPLRPQQLLRGTLFPSFLRRREVFPSTLSSITLLLFSATCSPSCKPPVNTEVSLSRQDPASRFTYLPHPRRLARTLLFFCTLTHTRCFRPSSSAPLGNEGWYSLRLTTEARPPACGLLVPRSHSSSSASSDARFSSANFRSTLRVWLLRLRARILLRLRARLNPAFRSLPLFLWLPARPSVRLSLSSFASWPLFLRSSLLKPLGFRTT